MTTLASAATALLRQNDPRVDYIILGGQKSPGRATVKGAGTPRDWDVQKGYGFSGAYVIFTGDNLARFSIEIYLWDFPKHWDDWAIFAKLLERSPAPAASATLGNGTFLPTTKPKALSIVHPLLNMSPLKITAVVIEDVTQFEQDDTGGWTCEIKCLQFRAPKTALAKPDAATPAANQPVSAADVAEQQMAAVAAQNTDLAARKAALLKVPQ